MKLFIWEGGGVLEDYTSGMIVALAADLETALQEIRKTCSYAMQSFPNDSPTTVIDLGECGNKPEPFATYVWGGG